MESVNAHFPESDKTQKGHMKSQRQGSRSTQEKEKEKNENESEEEVPMVPQKHQRMLPLKSGT